MYKSINFQELTGKVIESIEGGEAGDHEIIFKMTDGSAFKMYHEQNCCEYVRLEDVDGNLKDLIGDPILLAEEVSGHLEPPEHRHDESYTWTFYKLSTVKASCTLRWLGESNGYYSESVDFCQIKKANK